jgi:Zn-dependent metalloprotease
MQRKTSIGEPIAKPACFASCSLKPEEDLNMNARRYSKQPLFSHVLSLVMILSMMFPQARPQPAFAQSGDGLRREVNAESGRVNFIVPEGGRPLSASQALGKPIRPQDPGLELARRYGPEFGLKDPVRELTELRKSQAEDGRLTVHYQQQYQDIPVMGGELIVNTDGNGDLYSINGEISPDLSLPTQPSIDPEQARRTALESMAKWYGATAEDFVSTPPDLWIYDESLLQSSTRPVELTWRMEVTAKGNMPVRELVLVNAQRGSISLHFNQVDDTGENLSAQTQEIAALTTYYVTTTGNDANLCNTTGSPCLTINGALAKAATSGDIIKVATGTYTGTGTDAVLISKSVTLSGGWNASFSAQTGKSTIDGQNARRPLLINNSNTVAINNFNFQNSFAQYPYFADGAIFVYGQLTLSDSTIQNNQNRAIMLSGPSTLTLNNCIISNNVAQGSGHGGGIFTDSSNSQVIINNSTISNNSALSDYGGGIFIASGSSLTVNTSEIKYNQAINGGGIENQGTATINSSTIDHNTATASGGGIWGGGISNIGQLSILNSTISNNISRGFGGGIFSDGQVNIANSTISGNIGKTGGGFYSGDGGSTLNNVTITQNAAVGADSLSLGGGVYMDQNNPFPFIISNSILAGNTGDDGMDCYGPISSEGHNLIAIENGCNITTASGDITGFMGSSVDAKLGNLTNNGGSTLTHALLTGSPAINAGNSATCTSQDQRGVARPQSTACDMGAFEGSVSQNVTAVVKTYTANNTSALPGTFVCDQTDPTCADGDSQAKAAHQFAIGTISFYLNKFNRDGIDKNNMPILSTVNYCDPNAACPLDNAYWTGVQMVYGGAHGYALADDVVAHELTHGVTQYESNLFYYYQSGAINESFSDLWGEYYDQVGNVTSADTVGLKWLIGEDVAGLGALRSMINPPTYGDPDKMSSANYYEGAGDNGGVHQNSGVNNKAVYQMVDGGTFNGRTVAALGWDKVGAIYYEANTNLLTSGADYSDLYRALQQACTNLVGQKGITAGDCAEVKDALDAVEMNGQPAAGFNPDAPVCPTSGAIPGIVFADDLENGTANWTFTNGTYKRWQYDSAYGQYAQSGSHFLYADDYPDKVTDAKSQLKKIVIPANAYLWFAHAYDFEYDADGYYDGGVLEYSTNNGSTWTDASSLIESNGYKGTIATGYSNPLAGRKAFVGSSHGYISTRLNLSSLAGKAVNFRWRMGLDYVGSAWGWWVDNIKLYQCSASVKVSIGGTLMGSYDILPNQVVAKSYTAIQDGPVKVTSPAGAPLFSSERVISGTSFNEVMGYPTNQLTTEYWFPFYDNASMATWILVGNPTSSTAGVDIYVGGVKRSSDSIPAGGRVLRRFTGLQTGPVHVMSTNGVKIFTSERAVYKGAFNEVMGYPANQLTTEYWFPIYDNISMAAWIMVGNPTTSTASVNIYVGGAKKGSYSIAPGKSVMPRYNGLNAGPVRVVSTNNVKIFASERSLYGDSFNEVMGYPKDQFTTEYWYPWYDNVSMSTWVLVGNPTTTTAKVDIYVGTTKTSYSIGAGKSVMPRFTGMNTGPVRVVSTNGVKIFTSERVLYGTSFNEVMGYPGNKLSAEYWFPFYDSTTMSTNVLVGRP